MSKILVIGGGAAGMMAAAAAAEDGHTVVLLEKNEKLGKKLYITGKGRCNVTNACDRDAFFENMVSNPKFLYSSYGSWNSQDMMNWLTAHGLKLKVERGNRVFPVSDKSSDVIKTFQKILEQAGVQICLNTEVSGLFVEEEMCRGVYVKDRKMEADAVIVATGGLSYPTTGSTGDGYRWAEQTGHAVTALRPALVPMEAEFGDGSPAGELQGLALKNISVSIRKGKKELTNGFGEMMFTHFGVSGPALLSASSVVAKELEKGPLELTIDWKPALSEEQLSARILREFENGKNKILKNVVGNLLPARAVPVALRLSKIPPEIPVHEVTREARYSLVRVLKAFPMRLTGLRGYPEAIITQGGISVKEVHPATMESKRVKHLFFVGEILDLDGFTGGYNLQIAWSTGRAAGKAAGASEG
ncbi:NAD(P)/FAD-dependent oxidoreductase [Hominifimenecus sp. rT4P-3]|uniref:NAD(P)/FAD-dependent oxidoreductase n=1 Tax=Hominifimenecus sp. rT4P-3 TaxID=3242979 RepID=UPI003DA5FB3B